jgi:hypothetical protein
VLYVTSAAYELTLLFPLYFWSSSKELKARDGNMHEMFEHTITLTSKICLGWFKHSLSSSLY